MNGKTGFPGEEVGCIDKYNGYIVTSINRKMYKVHRLIWFWMTGSFPPKGMEIDHINRNKSDNRWCNLRLVTRAQNGWNRMPTGKDGIKGVRKFRGKKWMATICIGGIHRHLGTLETSEEAKAAYDTEARKLGGEYVCLNTIYTQ